jgi:hypothetical protein
MGIAVVVAAVAIWLLVFWPKRIAHAHVPLAKGTLAIQHALIYASPSSPPISNGTVLIQNGRISEVGPEVAIPVEGDALLPPRRGGRFLERSRSFHRIQWTNANWKSSGKLKRAVGGYAVQSWIYHRRGYRLKPHQYSASSAAH